MLYARAAGDRSAASIDGRVTSAMMNAMMQETLVIGTAHKAELPGWPAAGKTGTSQDFRDAWFIGYTANLVTGVWLGNDDNSPTKKATGGGLPVEIWSRFMRAAHQGVPGSRMPTSPGSACCRTSFSTDPIAPAVERCCPDRSAPSPSARTPDIAAECAERPVYNGYRQQPPRRPRPTTRPSRQLPSAKRAAGAASGSMAGADAVCSCESRHSLTQHSRRG